MYSDIENLDIMLGENHFSAREREGSLNSNLPRRARSFASNESENEVGTLVETREILTVEQIPNVTAIRLLAILVLR